MKKVLFVCLGNICRSSTAQGIMLQLIDQAGLTSQIHCESAGTISYHSGEKPDVRSQEYAQSRGVNLPGLARVMTKEDLADFDYIIAMDKNNFRDICSFDPYGTYKHKVLMICSFAGHNNFTEIPDPYYGAGNGFQIVFDLLLDACTGLLDKIKKELA